MDEKNPAVYLADMADACEKILRYCEHRTVTEFVGETPLLDTVLRRLTVLGVAAGRLDNNDPPCLTSEPPSSARDLVFVPPSNVDQR